MLSVEMEIPPTHRFHIGHQAGAEKEVLDKISLIEWLANHYKDFGANLQIVTDKSQEGAQFCRGFGGIGG